MAALSRSGPPCPLPSVGHCGDYNGRPLHICANVVRKNRAKNYANNK